jgi:hypothetical protein
MYRGLLITHNLFRWVVILAGVAAVASATWSLVRRQDYGPRHASLGRAFVITVDIQVVMGAALYALFSPLTTVAMDLGITPPPGSEMHFFSVTHVQIMAAVLVGVHLSAVIIRRGHGGIARLRRNVLCYGLTLALLLFGVPWWRPLWRF